MDHLLSGDNIEASEVIEIAGSAERWMTTSLHGFLTLKSQWLLTIIPNCIILYYIVYNSICIIYKQLYTYTIQLEPYARSKIRDSSASSSIANVFSSSSFSPGARDLSNAWSLAAPLTQARVGYGFWPAGAGTRQESAGTRVHGLPGSPG